MLIMLLIFIFVRPFIAATAFPELNLYYCLPFFVFMAAWFIYKKPELKNLRQIKYPLALFILAILFSLLFSQDKISGINQLYRYAGGIALFLACANLAQENKQKVMRCLLIAGILISILAIQQYFFGFKITEEYVAQNNITNPFVLDYLANKRVFIPFSTPNILAGYLAMLIALALSDKYKTLFIIPLSLALLLTRSLGGISSILCGIIIYACLKKWTGKQWLIMLIIILSAGILFYLRISYSKEQFQPEFSTLMRLSYWKDTLEIITMHPIKGVGLGNFDLAQTRYTHNFFLQIWAEMGIFGLVFFLWLFAACIKEGLSNKNLLRQNAGLITAASVFLIHNLVDFTFFLPESSFSWWVILGMLLYKQPSKSQILQSSA